MEKIQLIASGYEWDCPHCEMGQYISELPKSNHVTCVGCTSEFEIAQVNHATE